MNDGSPTDDVFAPAELRPLLERAFAEDHVRDDVTVAAVLRGGRAAPRMRAELLAKEAGVIAGLPLVGPAFRLLDPKADVELLGEDGMRVAGRTTLAWVDAAPDALLRGERVVLNLLQRLSGIASKTATYMECTLATGAQIFDTRKTTPGLRALEKYAVRCGGGSNHRMHLADAAMIKENHLVAAHGARGPQALAAAVTDCLDALDSARTLYVEVESQAELEAALDAAGDASGPPGRHAG